MTELKLKRCPFCGGEAVVDSVPDINFESGKNYFIRCRCCAAEGGWGKCQAVAEHKWNMRVGEAKP